MTWPPPNQGCSKPPRADVPVGPTAQAASTVRGKSRPLASSQSQDREQGPKLRPKVHLLLRGQWAHKARNAQPGVDVMPLGRGKGLQTGQRWGTGGGGRGGAGALQGEQTGPRGQRKLRLSKRNEEVKPKCLPSYQLLYLGQCCRERKRTTVSQVCCPSQWERLGRRGRPLVPVPGVQRAHSRCHQNVGRSPHGHQLGLWLHNTPHLEALC